MTAVSASLPGLHHVTAITGDAQKNIDFYCGVLGLRLVKLTVNFDDPGSYHLYYGDGLGRPGTIMTFFAWPGAPRGQIGPPQVTTTSFSVPANALAFWQEWLAKHGVTPAPIVGRFDEQVLGFTDPEGMSLEIVAAEQSGGIPWPDGPIPTAHAIRGFNGVTLSEVGYQGTANVLTDVMGFTLFASEGNRFRYRANAGAGDAFASIVDILCVPGGRRGGMGSGIVHHVAFRTPDDPQQVSWREKLVRLKFDVSPVMDRTYFHSIYFREPGGVLFEIATENPGFTADEPVEKLGTRLMLPPQLELFREEIERVVPPVRLPLVLKL